MSARTLASPANSEWLTRRKLIDPQLRAAGWTIVEQGKYDPAALTSRGATANPFDFGGCRVPFLYATNGEVIWHHDIRYSLPPLNEQRRIVAKLDAVLGKVDACQQRLAKIPVILKRFRQAVLAAACSGRLTADWREENEGAVGAGLALLRAQQAAPLQNRGEGEELPEGWVNCPLSELAELITKGASPKWQGVNYSPNGVLFVTSENVGNGKLLLDSKKYVAVKINEIQPRSVLRRGDILTNIVGASIGRSAIYDSDEVANINQAVALVRLEAGTCTKFITQVLNSPSMLAHMYEEKVDVARANLSLADVRSFPIPLPPLPEQHEIVRRVEALFTLADQLEARYLKAKAHVDRLTQSVLAKAFRGELVPQDENDEPAAALLERIRAVAAQHAARGSVPVRRPRARHAAPLRNPDGIGHVGAGGVRPGRMPCAPTQPLPLVAETPTNYGRNIPQAILAHMQPGIEYSRADIIDALGLSTSDWTWAIRQLKEEGKVVQTGERRGARYKVC